MKQKLKIGNTERKNAEKRICKQVMTIRMERQKKFKVKKEAGKEFWSAREINRKRERVRE